MKTDPNKILITQKLITECRSPSGGFTRATIEALGSTWPLKSGWMERLDGTQIYASQFEKAKAGRTKKRKWKQPKWMVKMIARREKRLTHRSE